MDGSRNDGIYILFMKSHKIKIGVSSIHIDILHTLHTYFIPFIPMNRDRTEESREFGNWNLGQIQMEMN